MNILVNTRLLQPGKIEGIGAFIHNLFKYVTKKNPEHTFYFLFDRKYDEKFIYSKNVIPLKYAPPTRHPLLNIYWFEFVVPLVAKKYKIDLFFSPDNLMSLNLKIPTVLVIHDINYKKMPENLPLITRHYYNFFVPKYLKKAKHIITVSEFTKKEIIESYKVPAEKISVIYNAPNIIENYIPDNIIDETRKKYTYGKPYFLYIGSLHPRKNIGRMLIAFDEFIERTKKDFYFIIIGRHLWRSYRIEEYNKIKNKERIIFTGYLPNEEARNILVSAYCLVLVSLYEGFGIPIIEAMQAGVPVICSNVTALPEIAGDAALFVNPLSIEEITSSMIKITDDKNLYNFLKQKGIERSHNFSWEKSSENLMKIIKNAVMH
ncbi:MAG: glycosyltransferase family 4 protein [Bacteroidales bacterium]|nr:glycosyltransferase family 4 protein [Bacteroidales bacterium]